MKPRHDLTIAKKNNAAIESPSGIVLPTESKATMVQFTIISVGPNVTDLKEGDKVLAEDMTEAIPGTDNVLLNSKYIHLIF